jgi:hypothetical protein
VQLETVLANDDVAQIFTLLYRGFEIRTASESQASSVFRGVAECNSAIQQSATLRYIGCGSEHRQAAPVIYCQKKSGSNKICRAVTILPSVATNQ